MGYKGGLLHRLIKRKILRFIFGPIKTNDQEYRTRYNFEIRRLLEGPVIIGYIRSKRLSWLGYVLNTKEKSRIQYRAYWTEMPINGFLAVRPSIMVHEHWSGIQSEKHYERG
jgi:hypothetical protein